MHSDKVPAVSADYTASDIVEDIYFALYKKINSLITAGMSKENIIADTGIGFGKSQDSCFEILKRHGEFKSLNVPMLLGISRKSFMRNKFNADFNEADIPTAYYSAVVKNVQIHRVHNVRLTKKYLEFAEAITFP